MKPNKKINLYTNQIGNRNRIFSLISIGSIVVALFLFQCKETDSTDDLEFFLKKTKTDALELRKEPSLDSEVIATIPKGTKIIDKKERSDTKVTVSLDGKEVETYFHKVMLADDTIGWVFEEAVEVVRALPEVK
ncbi:MAG: SH3 domain-containing protein [Leptospira sp.]|nr:SH3 domain-containing protein [Leptospira sp.]